MIDARVQAGDFDPGAQLARLEELGVKAVASFLGRLDAPQGISETWIDHYPQLARDELMRIAAHADSQWSLDGIILIHRHGRIDPGGRVLLAAAAGEDPEAVNQACAWMVGEMRRCAPFWRKDIFEDGRSLWREVQPA